MKASTSQNRIKELMDTYGINQTELCKRTGIQKSALSNYLSGIREPRQDQISLIADPFGVNPAWLMGYDVPMLMAQTAPTFNLTEEEYQLVMSFRSSDQEKKDLVKRLMKYDGIGKEGANESN